MRNIIERITEAKSCPYCDIKSKELNSLYGKELPNCSGDDYFGVVYQDWGTEDEEYHVLISTGRKGGCYMPKFCPECGRKLV